MPAVLIPRSCPKPSVADTPHTRSHLCGLLGRQSVLGHQPDLFLTSETGESGRVVFFFPWHIPSLPLASFKGGSSECFSVCAEGDTCPACPSWEFRNAKAGTVGCAGPRAQGKGQVFPGVSLLDKEEGRGPPPGSLAGPGGLGIPWPHGEAGMEAPTLGAGTLGDHQWAAQTLL